MTYDAPVEYDGGKWLGDPRVSYRERRDAAISDVASTDLIVDVLATTGSESADVDLTLDQKSQIRTDIASDTDVDK